MVKHSIKKKLQCRYHKNILNNSKSINYSILLHYRENQIGLGDGLTNIILNYSTEKMFGKPIVFDKNGYIGDKRPQMIICDNHNYNNIIPYIENDENISSECYEGQIFRKNINLQRLSRKIVFWNTCKIIQEDLFVSLLARSSMKSNNVLYVNNSLFCYLPYEIIEIIIKNILSLGLFNTFGIDYTNKPLDKCY